MRLVGPDWNVAECRTPKLLEVLGNKSGSMMSVVAAYHTLRQLSRSYPAAIRQAIPTTHHPLTITVPSMSALGTRG